MNGLNNQFPQIKLVSALPLPAPEKKSGLIIKIILGVVIGVIILGGAFLGVLASRVFDPLWNPFRPEPEEVLLKALNNINAVKIMHTDTYSGLEIKDVTPGKSEIFAFTVISDIDNSDLKNPKQQSVFELSGTTLEGFTITVEARVIGNDIYLNIKKLDSEELSSFLMATLGADINQFKNVWIKVDAQSLAGLAGVAPQITNNQQLTEKLQQIFLNNKLFSVKSELPDIKVEKVGGVAGVLTYHYVLALDNAVVVKAVSDAINLIMQEQLKSNNNLAALGSGASPAFITATVEGILSKVLDSIGEIDINTWIGKKDNLPYKFFLKKTIPLADIVKAYYGAQDLGMAITGAITFEIDERFSKFNEPVQIKAPENPRNFSDLLAPLIANYQLKSNDAAISDNMLQIQSVADSVYQSKKSYSSLTCKNAAIKPFCEEIKNIAGVYPTIKVSKSKYCAYSKLVTPGNYFCVDNQGYYEVSVNPAGKGYCNGITFICPSINLLSP